MATEHPNLTVTVTHQPSAVRTYGAEDRDKIHEIVRDHVLLASYAPYHSATSKVEHDEAGDPKSILVTLLHRHTWTAEFARVAVDKDLAVQSVDRDVAPVEEDEQPRTYSTKDFGSFDMVFGTPVPEISTALNAINNAYNTAVANGFHPIKLLGSDASVANYAACLQAKPLAFGTVGHGWTGGIVLWDGNLTASWFNGQNIDPVVLFTSSCQTFNPPFVTAIMNAHTRTFVGGVINLLIGPSEQVFMCFWNKVLSRSQAMGGALTGCEQSTHYPDPGAFGIAGDQGMF